MRVGLMIAFVCGTTFVALGDDAPEPSKEQQRQVTIYRLKYISPTIAAEQLRERFADAPGMKPNDKSAPAVVAVPDKSTNTLLVSSTADLADSAHWVVRLADIDGSEKSDPCKGWCHEIPTESNDTLQLSKTISDWAAWGRPVEHLHEDFRIMESLNKKVSLGFDDVSLKDVLRHVASIEDFNIYVDSAGMKDSGVSWQTPVSFRVRQMRLGEALEKLLGTLNLNFTIRDEVIVVDSTRRLANVPLRRMYPVPDLLVMVKDGKPVIDFNSLAHRIQSAVTPESWETKGGEASVRRIESKLSLVIQQSTEGHKQVAAFLKKLRAERASEFHLDADTQAEAGR